MAGLGGQNDFHGSIKAHTLSNINALSWEYLIMRTLRQSCFGSGDALSGSLRFLLKTHLLPESPIKLLNLRLPEVLSESKVLAWVSKALFMPVANWGLAYLKSFQIKFGCTCTKG